MGQRTPGQDRGGAGSAGSHPGAADGAADGAPGRRRRASSAALWTMVAGLAAAAIALPLADPGGGDHPSGPNARLAVRDALTASMGESTVQVTFSASVGIAGTTAQLRGTGGADLTNKSAVMHVSGTVSGQNQAATVEVTGGTVYVQVPQVAALDPGKSWLSLRPGSSTGFGSSVGSLGTFADPSTVLAFLERSGAVVTPLGASTRTGTSEQGYRVTMDEGAVASAASAAGLPAGAAGQVHQLVLTAYISGGLLRSLDVDETGTVPVSASIDLHGYGQPVSVLPPAPTTVAPFSQFAGVTQLPATSLSA